jgi:hypothetical protein
MGDFNRIINKSLEILSTEEDIFFSGLHEGLSGIILYLAYLKRYHSGKSVHAIFDKYYFRP